MAQQSRDKEAEPAKANFCFLRKECIRCLYTWLKRVASRFDNTHFKKMALYEITTTLKNTTT
tara:strand:+ start:301 stop:486 length:186 start_codon:yes stop_codon:yes gene_type:complete